MQRKVCPLATDTKNCGMYQKTRNSFVHSFFLSLSLPPPTSPPLLLVIIQPMSDELPDVFFSLSYSPALWQVCSEVCCEKGGSTYWRQASIIPDLINPQGWGCWAFEMQLWSKLAGLLYRIHPRLWRFSTKKKAKYLTVMFLYWLHI